MSKKTLIGFVVRIFQDYIKTGPFVFEGFLLLQIYAILVARSSGTKKA